MRDLRYSAIRITQIVIIILITLIIDIQIIGQSCSYIKREIRNDQISGGMVGQYNPSITQRLNNLTEKSDITTNGQAISEIKVNIIKSGDKLVQSYLRKIMQLLMILL
jgi:hypothetical protein